MTVALRLGVGTAVVSAVCTAVFFALAGAAAAQPRVTHLSLQHGALRLSAPIAAASASAAKSVTVTVTDARGSGAGWSLRLITTKPVAVTRVTARCAVRSTCTLPRAVGLGPRPLVLRSQAGSGMGSIRLTVTLARLTAGPPVPVMFAVSG